MVAPKSADNNRTTPIGTGPFKFVNWAKGDKVELEKNAAYWDKAVAVKLEKATFRFVSDPQAQAAALKSGDIDAFPEFGAPELMTSFDGDARLGTFVGNTELKVVAGMNNARKPFNDKRVRQALMMAVDRGTVIEGAWSGYGTAIGSHYTPNDRGYIDTTGVHSYDIDKAKALLAEAGYPDGFSFTIKAPQMAYAQRTSQILQAMLAEIGVTMTIETTEFPAKWVADVLKGADYDMTIVAHAEPMDIDIYSRDPYYFNYKNPAFNEVIANVEKTADAAEQEKLYGEAQKILAEDVCGAVLVRDAETRRLGQEVEGVVGKRTHSVQCADGCALGRVTFVVNGEAHSYPPPHSCACHRNPASPSRWAERNLSAVQARFGWIPVTSTGVREECAGMTINPSATSRNETTQGKNARC